MGEHVPELRLHSGSRTQTPVAGVNLVHSRACNFRFLFSGSFDTSVSFSSTPTLPSEFRISHKARILWMVHPASSWARWMHLAGTCIHRTRKLLLLVLYLHDKLGLDVFNTDGGQVRSKPNRLCNATVLE